MLGCKTQYDFSMRTTRLEEHVRAGLKVLLSIFFLKETLGTAVGGIRVYLFLSQPVFSDDTFQNIQHGTG